MKNCQDKEIRADVYHAVQFVRRAWRDGYVREAGADVMRLLLKGGGLLFGKAKTTMGIVSVLCGRNLRKSSG